MGAADTDAFAGEGAGTLMRGSVWPLTKFEFGAEGKDRWKNRTAGLHIEVPRISIFNSKNQAVIISPRDAPLGWM